MVGIPLGMDKSDSEWGQARCNTSTLILNAVVTVSQILLLFR